MDSSQAGTPASPPKGQGNDSSRKAWRSSWWDFYPLLERPRRPLVWSQSSVIWTAHPTQALIIGRHFSSSKQFVLPSPTPVVSSPASFEPPTVIVVSPTDDWLFAFYPREDGEGVGCIWKRGPQIDNWGINESWSFAKCAGAVTASWLGGPREWAFSSSGTPMRLPCRGPATPVSSPTLVVVTEDCGLCIFYYRYVVPGLRSIKRSLVFPGITPESSHQLTATDGLESCNAAKHCMDATISIGYNEKSIFIATHSRRVPAPLLTSDPIDAAQFNFDSTGPQRPEDYEIWGEEHTVEIHEVHLKFDGVIMNILCHTFGTVDIVNASLANMIFLSSPPALQLTVDQNTRKTLERGRTFLVLSTMDFHDYISPPTSNLSLYSITQKISRVPHSLLSLNHDSSRKISEGVAVYIDSFVDFSATYSILMQVYVLHHSGSLLPGDGKAKELPTGNIHVLNIPDLSDNAQFDSSPVDYPWDYIGRDLPVYASTSPNRRLLCTLSSSRWKTRIMIHNLPKRKTLEHRCIALLPITLLKMLTVQIVASYWASQLAIATLERRSTADITHEIVSPRMSLPETANIIFHSLRMLENIKSSLPYAGTWDMMGVAVEVYREKARLSKDEKEREVLEDRWRMAHDICCIAACNIAFADCREEEGYDLEAAWQLIGLCAWVVAFTERLLKVAVLCNSSGIAQPLRGDKEYSSPFAPHLLHVVHPFTLQNLIVALNHVINLRTYVGSLPAGGENPQMAQLILTDTVDGSGINFRALVSLLEESLLIVTRMDSQLCQGALANCQPMPAMQPILMKLIAEISDSEKILNKTTLFIKPFDLVDGIARLSIDPRKADGNDVITKNFLPKEGPMVECLRCGGKTVGPKSMRKVVGMPAARWVIWERMWQLRCICGGPWFTVH